MSKRSHAASVLLTGVSGFLGKVVLAELLRRRQELAIETIYVLIRDKRNVSGAQRFQQTIANSPCFSRLQTGWQERVKVVEGELSQADCGIKADTLTHLQSSITHIVHCAASIEFDLPIKQAATANIVGSLHVLELAKQCPNLKQMVSVSTAYVTPFKGAYTPVHERLSELPRPAEELFAGINDGTLCEKALLKQTGHPNTYTLTKCIAEHLLNERRGNVPLTLVRPSIISAARRYPFTGWIDSNAAFAGFVAMAGYGYLRAVVVDPATRLDVVPCDDVAARVIDATFAEAKEDSSITIRHAVAGYDNACRVDECIDIYTRFFQSFPLERPVDTRYAGAFGLPFLLIHWRYHQLEPFVMQMLARAIGQSKKARSLSRLRTKLTALNATFPYFTHSSFDFRTSVPLQDFKKHEYIHDACLGIYTNLLKQNATEATMPGHEGRRSGGDVLWSAKQPHGNIVIRASAYAFTKVLRLAARQVTFDKLSFARATERTHPNRPTVLVPSHRSYMDFLLCSYLFFARPDLKIEIPYIAAADDFAKIPFVGRLFTQMRAFYLKRGIGREDLQLTEQVHKLVQHNATLQFFIEGSRSRARRFLAPRRGLLRCLQKTGREFDVLPLSITYDRIPEERSFLNEIALGESTPMKLRTLAEWSARLLRGEIDLGRIHFRAGTPLVLNAQTDIPEFSRAIVASLQQAMTVTRFHLACFLREQQWQHDGVNAAWLENAIVARGGVVIDSPLTDDCQTVPPLLEKCLRHHFVHFFVHEALAAQPGNEALAHYANAVRFAPPPKVSQRETPAHRNAVLRALFLPVCDDYKALAQACKRLHERNPRLIVTPQAVFNEAAGSDETTLELAFEALVERGILVPHAEARDSYTFGPAIAQVDAFAQACTWTELQHVSAA